jgi:VanZ family protein
MITSKARMARISPLNQLKPATLFAAYWLPVISYCLIIFIQSAFPSPDVFPHLPHLDKLLHATGYALLGALFYRALRQSDRFINRPGWLLAISVAAATLYGASDEWHQSFVAARQADILDLLADFIGSTLGGAGYAALIAKGRCWAGHYSLIDKILHFL